VIACLIVGALLTVINHGDQLLPGEFDSTMAWQVGLAFLVPFVVATSSGAAAMEGQRDRRRGYPQHAIAGEARNVDLDPESSPAPRQ
jgi:hypothetical protein